MIEVTPAILEPDLESLRSQLSRLSGFTQTVQLDVCDGKFVTQKTWPYVHGGMEEFARITSEDEGLPFWDSVDFEIDLLVRHPESIVEDWIRAGAKSIVLHIESSPDILGLIEKLRTEYGTAKDESFGLQIGVSLNIDTPNEEIFEILDLVDEGGDSIVDFVQFMGIANVGYQGQEFDERVLEKISDLRDLYPNIPISVDGGVNFENAADIISVGATRLVSGSTILESDDIAEAIDYLKTAGE
jgi:ribulose-phosphate 3-epimerase